MVRHLDPDELVLLALGDATAGAADEHLAACPPCREELGSWQEVAALSRESGQAHDLPAPPERLWLGIAAAVARDTGAPRPVTPAAAARPDVPDSRSTGGGTAGRARRGSVDSGRARWGGGREGRSGRAGHGRGPAEVRRPRRIRDRWAMPALAAGVAAVLAAVGTAAVLDGRPDDDLPPPRVTAQADLARLPTAPAGVRGAARVLADDDGDRLHLHVTGMPLSTGYYEVWLINPETEQMISVGTLGGSADSLLPLPGTVDLRAYRVVDVSAEPFDGSPAHSGQSLLRGPLTG